MELIKTTTIEELNEDSNKIMKLSETYWKDYLAEKNYNKDVNKMCEICIEDQKKKFGRIRIPCNGLNTASNIAKGHFDKIVKNLSEQEVKELDAIYNPFTYMSLFSEFEQPNRKFEHRFYQELILSCSARTKVVRMGRRTGKSQSIAMLAVHKAIMNEGFRILLVSPYAVQTEEVINTIKNICLGLPEYPIESAKQTPAHKITFNNGSILMGFTASTDGNQIRGQPADLIILDETDDIPEKAITSIMGIKMQNPNVEVWRSGTPKGEGNLYRSEQDPSTKCFHFPSYVNPNYSDEMDESLRAEMGEGVGYVEEVLAEISTASNAVFQTMFINRAQNKTEFRTALEVLHDRQRFITFIGVDWNHDKVGTRILVMAYDKIVEQFFIIDKETVAVEGFTQAEAVEKIIALNRKYTCDHVFVDQGFGASQIAHLKKFALSVVGTVPKGHPDLKLLDLLPIDYGSFTEVQDPVSGQYYKTPTKQMAVMNCVEVLELDKITLHPKEDHDIILQLKNYIEKSRNKGRIVYSYLSKKIGDHDLDALMIGLFGMKKLYSSLFNPHSTEALIRFVNKDTEEVNITAEQMPGDGGIIGLSFGKKGSHVSDRVSNFNSNRQRNDSFKTVTNRRGIR